MEELLDREQFLFKELECFRENLGVVDKYLRMIELDFINTLSELHDLSLLQSEAIRIVHIGMLADGRWVSVLTSFSSLVSNEIAFLAKLYDMQPGASFFSVS